MDNDSIWSRIRSFPWRWIALLYTAIGVLQFFYHSLDRVARGMPADWIRIFAEEVTGTWAGLCITPLLAWVALAYPPREGRWKRYWHLYLVTGVVGGFLDTTIIYLMRIAVFIALGRGIYDYGNMKVRYFMELPAQLTWIAMIIVVISYSEHRRLAREREAHIDRLERQVTQARLETLQMQLHPHFLFNSLNAISAIVYEDPHVADRMIGSLSEFLRRVLRTDKSLEVPLSEELELLEFYLRVIRARFEAKLECTVKASPGISDALVPQLILQPLVENALRYAADPDTGHIVVSVSARRNGDRLILEICDRGPAIETVRSGNGIGLQNLADRLDRLYENAARLTIQNNPGQGTHVVVDLPYHTVGAMRSI